MGEDLNMLRGVTPRNRPRLEVLPPLFACPVGLDGCACLLVSRLALGGLVNLTVAEMPAKYQNNVMDDLWSFFKVIDFSVMWLFILPKV